MFEIGWSEILVIAVVAIIVVGPKDLPKMLRTFGGFVGKARRMAFDFQRQFNEVVREAERQAELEDVGKTIRDIRNYDPLRDVKASLTDAVSQPKVPAAAAAATAAPSPTAAVPTETAPPEVAPATSVQPAQPVPAQVVPSAPPVQPATPIAQDAGAEPVPAEHAGPSPAAPVAAEGEERR